MFPWKRRKIAARGFNVEFGFERERERQRVRGREIFAFFSRQNFIFFFKINFG